MGDSNSDKLGLVANKGNFGFAFNDRDFSDRVLRIEIIPPAPNKMRFHKNKAKDFHISSSILAAESPFFYQLFKNGMRETRQKHVTLKINASEEIALVDLLNFMYTNTLKATTSSELLDVLMIADKFQVVSCTKYCIEMLQKLPMSLDSILPYLELPSSIVLLVEAVEPLVDAAKQYLVEHYKDFAKSQKKAMKLPLSSLEVVLERGKILEVNSEDVVFEFILKWARSHYPNLIERREILTNHLMQYIRFPYMSCSKLKEAAICPDFEREQVSKMVVKAFHSKTELPYGQHNRASKDVTGRVYNERLIRVVELEYPWPSCVVYFDLTKDECVNLFPSKRIQSESFPLGGRRFYLVATCSKQHNPTVEHLCLYLYMTKNSESCQVSYEFSAMTKSSKVFQSRLKVENYTLTDKQGRGSSNLLGVSWTNMLRDDCNYFIDEILHLRGELIIHNS